MSHEDNIENLDPLKVAQGLRDQNANVKQALAMLLDHAIDQKGRIVVHKTFMGGSESYIGSVSLEWLAQRVQYATQLPLFKDRKIADENVGDVPHAILIDEKSIDDIIQRPPDWRRQAPLAQYLAVQQNHKFPPILAVVSHDWVDDPQSDEWGPNDRALQSSLSFQPMDSHGDLGMLDVSEEFRIFALDGQHRLMGVQGLIELINRGVLVRRDKDGKAKSSLDVGDILERYELDLAELQRRATERIGVEFIAAVVKGETREAARRRVRSIFVHVNRSNVQLSKSQLAQLDEDNGFMVVARRVAVSHALMKDRVNWESQAISSASAVLTSLHTLSEMSEGYLGPLFPHWKVSEKGLIPLRPSDHELGQGTVEFNDLVSRLADLPSYEALLQGAHPREFRAFPSERDPGEGHLLFRPVGQDALGSALGILINSRGLDKDEVFAKLRQYDNAGGFDMTDPANPWYGVVYDPVKQRVLVRGKRLAKDLLVYLLGGGIHDSDERVKLEERLMAERYNADTGVTIGWDGNGLGPTDVFALPPAL